jgi:hypothetical protein
MYVLLCMCVYIQGRREGGTRGSPGPPPQLLKKKIVYWSPHKKNTKVGLPPFVLLAPSLYIYIYMYVCMYVKGFMGP